MLTKVLAFGRGIKKAEKCVSFIWDYVVCLANVCIVGIQSSRAGTLCSDRESKRENISFCARVCECVSACANVHVCLYAAYSEQLDCQTGV